MFLKHTTCVFIGWFSLVFISTCGIHSLFRSANFDRFLATRHAGPFSLTSQVKSAEACAVKCLRNNTCNAAMATTGDGITNCYFIETDHIATESHRSADANSVLFGEFHRHPLLTHYIICLIRICTCTSVREFFCPNCSNGGVCLSNDSTSYCQCPDGYAGETCEGMHVHTYTSTYVQFYTVHHVHAFN